jgi:hypothetical protein
MARFIRTISLSFHFISFHFTSLAFRFIWKVWFLLIARVPSDAHHKEFLEVQRRSSLASFGSRFLMHHFWDSQMPIRNHFEGFWCHYEVPLWSHYYGF